jgi:6-phospho-3-hexuloisomerase
MIATVLAEIDAVLARVDDSAPADAAARLMQVPRVFVTGEGRSGFMARAFAMRLMHLGLPVHVIGETVTPALREGDLVVAISGSGTTETTVRHAERAVTTGGAVLAVTSAPDSPLAALADATLLIPAATKYARAGTIQPLSSLFDQCTHIVLDVVCLEIAQARGVDNAAAVAAHANTE